jgi:hypothetical protein
VSSGLPRGANGEKGLTVIAVYIYIAESGANFWNIVKGPVHGEKCVHNYVLKNCNCLFFLNLSPYIFKVFYEFLMIGFLRTLLILLIFYWKQFFILIDPFIINFGIDFIAINLLIIFWNWQIYN